MGCCSANVLMTQNGHASQVDQNPVWGNRFQSADLSRNIPSLGGAMENAYRPELWQNVFVVLGSSSAALNGLLFIATSLHLQEIVSNPVMLRRAFNNTRFLLIILVEALLILIPQPMRVLGAELVAINLLGLWLPLRFVYLFFANREDFRRGGALFYRAIIFRVSFLLGIAGGAALISHLNWGIYLIATSCVILLVRAVLTAWSIMLGVGQTERQKGREGKNVFPRLMHPGGMSLLAQSGHSILRCQCPLSGVKRTSSGHHWRAVDMALSRPGKTE